MVTSVTKKEIQLHGEQKSNRNVAKMLRFDLTHIYKHHILIELQKWEF